MVEVEVRIIEEATKKDGETYWKAETSGGQMSIWDKEIADKLVDLPKTYNLAIKEKGTYKNILGIHDLSEQEMGKLTSKYIPEDKAEKTIMKKFVDSDEKRFAGMAISYAKDLVVAGKMEYSNLRKEALGLRNLYKEMIAVEE